MYPYLLQSSRAWTIWGRTLAAKNDSRVVARMSRFLLPSFDTRAEMLLLSAPGEVLPQGGVQRTWLNSWSIAVAESGETTFDLAGSSCRPFSGMLPGDSCVSQDPYIVKEHRWLLSALQTKRV